MLVEGKLSYRQYDDKEGNRHHISELVADHVILLDKNLHKKRIFKKKALISKVAPKTPFAMQPVFIKKMRRKKEIRNVGIGAHKPGSTIT